MRMLDLTWWPRACCGMCKCFRRWWGSHWRLPKRSCSSAASIIAFMGVSISVPDTIELMPGSNILRIRQTVRFDGCRSVELSDSALSAWGMMCAASVLIPICWILRPVRLRRLSMYFRSCLRVTTRRFPSRARQSLRKLWSRLGVPCSGPTPLLRADLGSGLHGFRRGTCRAPRCAQRSRVHLQWGCARISRETTGAAAPCFRREPRSQGRLRVRVQCFRPYRPILPVRPVRPHSRRLPYRHPHGACEAPRWRPRSRRK